MTQRRKVAAVILSVVTLCSSAAGADAIRLRFRPPIGQKRTMQITSRLVCTPSTPPHATPTEHLWILTLELEPVAITRDGAVTLKATFRRIQNKLLLSPTECMNAFDSAHEERRLQNPMGGGHEVPMGMCLAPIGESFTAVVSADGHIKSVNTQAFCATVARKRVQYEDDVVRSQVTKLKEREYKKKDEATRRRLVEAEVEKVITRVNGKYGSATRRESEYEEEASESFLFGLQKLRWLLHDVLVPFPSGPLGQDGRWTAPVMIRAEGPIELPGTYTLQSQDGDTCTIQVEAKRTMKDQALGTLGVEPAHLTKLAGPYRAIVKIDRTTGALLSKETSMDLAGTTPTIIPDRPQDTKMVQVTLKATTTVEVLP